MSVSVERQRLEQAYIELRWRKAAHDPEFFFDQCLMIPSQRDDSGREPLRLWPYQRDDLNTFLAERFVVVLKARQIGLSTLVAARMLWGALFNPGFVGLWVSSTQEDANKAVGMLNVMWQFMPRWAKDRAPTLDVNQAGLKEWVFPDGARSRIRAFPGTGKAGAGETSSVVVLDEFALVEAQDDLLRSAQPTTDAGGQLIIISTARGGNNRFAKTFREAQRGGGLYKPVFHPWFVSRWMNPKADVLETCDECGGEGLIDTGDGTTFCAACVDTVKYDARARQFADEPWRFHAEYPSTPEEAFRESGRPRFTRLPTDIHPQIETEWVRGDLYPDEEGRLRFEPDPSGLAPLRVRADVAAEGPARWRDYVVHIDPSGGTGNDYTAAQVLAWDEDAKPEVLAWWADNTIEPTESAREFDKVGRWFTGRDDRPALLGVEIAGGWGDSMLQELRYLSYPRLYTHRETNRRRSQANRVGLPMTQQTRPLVIDRLAAYVQLDDAGDLPLDGMYPELLDELRSFVHHETGKLSADVGCHDDLVMSCAGAIYLLEQRIPATEPPTGEGGLRVAPEPSKNNLQAMFDEIEQQRRQQEHEFSRQVKRSMRRRQRRDSRSRSRALR